MFPRPGGSAVPGPLFQDSGVIAFENHHGHLQARDVELADHVAAMHRLRRGWAADCHRLDQPSFRLPLRGDPLVQRPPVPRQERSAPIVRALPSHRNYRRFRMGPGQAKELRRDANTAAMPPNIARPPMSSRPEYPPVFGRTGSVLFWPLVETTLNKELQ
jgi:hypothetical protein